jgi:hypothetical protein
MKYIGLIRPQIMVAIVGLILIGGYALRIGVEPVAVGALTGIVALAKDVLAVDND